MDPGWELKRLQQAKVIRHVSSNECDVAVSKDDPDGERVTLTITVPGHAGASKTFSLGSVHVSASPQQLDAIIRGAIFAAHEIENDTRRNEHETQARAVFREMMSQRMSHTQRNWPVGSPGPYPDEFDGDIQEQGFKPSNAEPDLTDNLNVEAVTNPSSLISHISQRGDIELSDVAWPEDVVHCTTIGQVHQNTCGYHALYNASLSLRARGCSDIEAECDNYESFWCFVFRAMARLKMHQAKAGLWSTSQLDKAILDAVHLDYLIRTDPFIRGRVTIVDSLESLQAQISAIGNCFEKHSFILECSSHWICATLVAPRCALLMDSFNKPLSTLTSAIDSHSLAVQVVETYRQSFRNRMREVSRYEHYPDEVIDRIYDEGVPEYWRGRTKDPMFWHHRPARMRVEIMFRELERARAYITCIRNELKKAHQEHVSSSTERKSVLPWREDKRPQQHFPGVYQNLTHEMPAFAGYVRRDENLKKGDVGYNPDAPPTLESRKRPPLPEIKGDAFDRQRVIPGFDQSLIERQVCLVVGTGGIGMNTALTLARVGVDEICMVDFDVYDASNLTRQCLGTRSDIGRKKTEVALHNIQDHNLRSRIRVLDIDVVLEWSKLVEAARRSTVIFNCCDAGLMLDFALNSLSKELMIPLCCGQSFGWKFMSEIYTGQSSHNCAFCQEHARSTFSLHDGPGVFARFKAFGQDKDAHAQIEDFLVQDQGFRTAPGSITTLMRSSNELSRAAKGITNVESMGEFLRLYHDTVIRLMLPGSIGRLESLGMVPRPTPPSTRFIGSWVCPCLACGAIMVSHWAHLLTGPDPERRNPPTTILFNMDEGMSAEEQMAYECGLAPERSERSFARSSPRSDCQICASAADLDRRKRLWIGTDQVFLRPAVGERGQAVVKPRWSRQPPGENARDAAVAVLKGDAFESNRLGDHEYPEIILIPRVPAVDPEVEEPCDDLPNETSAWPFADLGAVPIVKSSREDCIQWPQNWTGIASGIRSAIILSPRSSRFYRLKGCGNESAGFVLEVKGNDHKQRSLRGCMFEGTAARELFMSDLIARECKIICGNRPLGFYRYPRERPETISSQLQWEREDITKFCAVFETLGDRRLGDHLVAGLEILVSRSCSHSLKVQITDIIHQSLTSVANERIADGHILDTARAIEGGLTVVDFTTVIHELSSCDEVEQLRSVLSLVQRAGWEVGNIMLSLSNAGISWGTFADEMGIHCNAHANNLIVVAPSEIASSFTNCENSLDFSLLAAVDFDMAFMRESYIGDLINNASNAGFIPRDFDDIILFEQTMGMRTSLAGSDFTNTGVENSFMDCGETLDMHRDLVENILRIVIRDTLVLSYDRGLAGAPAPHLMSLSNRIPIIEEAFRLLDSNRSSQRDESPRN